MAGQQAGHGFETVKAYTGDYAAKAQELVGTARQKMPSTQQAKDSMVETTQSAKSSTLRTAQQAQDYVSRNVGMDGKTNGINQDDFPTAPKTEFPSSAQDAQPSVGTEGTNGMPIASS